ncbi:MAG: ATP-binding cassette domain-containing protein, partial [Bacteroidia bacterium]|nr:ATP-binding cassette domain-containing protein [Bacteroidia bacterium]
LNNVSVFQQNNLVLSNVNLEIFESEFIYLIGQTGSGKSTLLKTLYADLSLTQGDGRVADFNLHQLKTNQIPFLRRKIGIVFQDFQLLTDRSVYENLYFVLQATDWKNKGEMDSRINEVLEMVGLDTKSFKMPFELSGGEQQRLVIARALLNKPAVILADEPTGNLDPETSNGIMELLHQIAKNETAVLMATHDYRLINKYPGRILRCENGSISEMAMLEEKLMGN